jgi:uncharacterized OB-fold protein
MIDAIPLPVTDNPVDARFWQGCRDGELLIQHCGDCSAAQHPPRAMCPVCRSMRLIWLPALGSGTIWSFAIPGPPLLPAFTVMLPYVVAVVVPDDHPDLRLVGALTADGAAIGGIDPCAVRIGASVGVRFVRAAEDVSLPCWALSAPASLPQDDQP